MTAILKEGRGKRGKKTLEEAAYVRRCVDFGCLLTWKLFGVEGELCEFHHVRSGTGAGCISSHMRGFALSPEFHRLGNHAIHVMGARAFSRHHGITELDLLELSHSMFLKER